MAGERPDRFSVDAWEPSYDTELWKIQQKLHIFVQETHQGDGEKVKASEATPVYVLAINSISQNSLYNDLKIRLLKISRF